MMMRMVIGTMGIELLIRQVPWLGIFKHRLVARKKVYDDMRLVLGEIARVQKALQVDPGTQFIFIFSMAQLALGNPL